MAGRFTGSGLKLERVLHTEAPEFLRRYASAVGMEEMRTAFDWPATFRFPLPTERIWVHREHGVDAAWGSLVIDAYGTSAATRVGVWPEWRRQGYWHDMLMALRDKAFAIPEIRAIRSMVLLSNVEHAARMIRMTEKTSWYRFDGMSLHPPAYHIITLREDWDKARA